MSIVVNVNGESINYPQTGDTNWGDEATDFAVQTSSAFSKVGLSTGTTVDLPGTLDVTGNTTLDANLSVGGNASVTGTTSLTGNVTLTNNLTVNGNTQLGNANTDTIGITGIVNVDSGVLYVDPTNNRIGINDTTPSEALDVTGNAVITGNLAVDTNTLYVDATNNRVGVVNSSPSKALDVTGEIQSSSHITCNGVVYADDDTTANTPVISFIGDTNTGIGRNAADTLDLITAGNPRFRIESTGQIKAVYESQVGTDYNTRLDNGYFCRAWVNFNGTGTVAIRASGNVTSITDNNIGDYTVNFTTAMPDTDYSVVFGGRVATAGARPTGYNLNRAITSSAFPIATTTGDYSGLSDSNEVFMAVFR